MFRNLLPRIPAFIVAIALRIAALVLPSLLDRALKGLNQVETLLVRAAADAQTRLDAEQARRVAIYAQMDASYAATDTIRSDLQRAERVRQRLANLIA